MPEEFEGRDLTDAVFWGVDLRRAMFRDVDLSGVRISHARLVDVGVDGLVERLTVNGVDVTAYVNERDPWYPLRAMLRPTDPPGMRAAWAALEQAWAAALVRARQLTDRQLHESVGGEWSFVQTLRHLVFAMDKWVSLPVLGDRSFTPMGMPNSGSVDFGWPGLDQTLQPTLDEVLAVRASLASRFRDLLDTVTPDDLRRHVVVLENGEVTVDECVWTVFEEEFEHLRYATRDLAQLEGER